MRTMVAGGPGDVWIQWASAQRKSQRSTPDGWRAEYGTTRRGAATAAAAAPIRTRQTGARTKQRSRMDVDHGHNKAKATPEEEKRVLLRELSAALETSAAAQSRASRLSVSSLTSGLGSVNSLPTSPLLEPTSHARDFLTVGGRGTCSAGISSAASSCLSADAAVVIESADGSAATRDVGADDGAVFSDGEDESVTRKCGDKEGTPAGTTAAGVVSGSMQYPQVLRRIYSLPPPPPAASDLLPPAIAGAKIPAAEAMAPSDASGHPFANAAERQSDAVSIAIAVPHGPHHTPASPPPPPRLCGAAKTADSAEVHSPSPIRAPRPPAGSTDEGTLQPNTDLLPPSLSSATRTPSGVHQPAVPHSVQPSYPPPPSVASTARTVPLSRAASTAAAATARSAQRARARVASATNWLGSTVSPTRPAQGRKVPVSGPSVTPRGKASAFTPTATTTATAAAATAATFRAAPRSVSRSDGSYGRAARAATPPAATVLWMGEHGTTAASFTPAARTAAATDGDELLRRRSTADGTDDPLPPRTIPTVSISLDRFPASTAAAAKRHAPVREADISTSGIALPVLTPRDRPSAADTSKSTAASPPPLLWEERPARSCAPPTQPTVSAAEGDAASGAACAGGVRMEDVESDEDEPQWLKSASAVLFNTTGGAASGST